MSATDMTGRPEPLARFVDALRVAVAQAAPAGGEAGAAARRMFSSLERPGRPGEEGPAERLDTCGHLPAALVNARAGPAPVAALADALHRLAPALCWRRRAGSAQHGASFHHGHANAWLAGPDACERRSDVVVGVSLLAPGIRYPDHQHPPEEIYLVMSAGDWYQPETGWHAPGIGGVVYHRPGVTHAMRSGDSPLLAVWCLWTGTD